jgi:hypothetical protein
VSGPFTLHPEEISDGRWISAADLLAELERAPETFAGAIRHLWAHHRDAILAMLPPTA